MLLTTEIAEESLKSKSVVIARSEGVIFFVKNETSALSFVARKDSLHFPSFFSAFSAGSAVKSYLSDRKSYRECRALALLARHVDPAAVVLNDPVGDGETESSAVLLGRKKRAEKLLAIAFRDPDARVRNPHLDGIAPKAALNGQHAAVGHCLDSVQDQVQKRLFQHARIEAALGDGR